MKEEKFPHTRKPLHWWRWGVVVEGNFRATEESAATGCRGQSGEIPAQRIGADQHSATREACLLTCQGGQGLGAEARASEDGSQGEDWCWLHEHSLKGASAPLLAGRESGKKSGPSEEARDHCFGVCKKKGFFPTVPTEGRVPPE